MGPAGLTERGKHLPARGLRAQTIPTVALMLAISKLRNRKKKRAKEKFLQEQMSRKK